MGRERLLVKEHTEYALIKPCCKLSTIVFTIKPGLFHNRCSGSDGRAVQPNQTCSTHQDKETAIRNPQRPAAPEVSPLVSAAPQLQLLHPAGLGSAVAYADIMGEN